MGGIDYETINAQALAAYPELLKRWFPAGRVAGREFMAGNLQGAPGDSLKINIDTGIGADFATDETFGDPISLNALRLKCRASEAALDLAETLGTGLAGEMHGHGHQSNGRNNDTIVPIVPVPREASQMHYHHREHGAPSQCWPYHDAEGRLMGYVCRWDTQSSDGTLDKEIRPVTWCDLGNGKRGWRAKGIPAPRPLLNLPGILASPDTPVLVCEGEKAAEAAAKRFPDTVATTPMHGAQSPHMTDWSVLEGREVTVWPDADEAGAGFADTVARLAREAGAASVRIVQVPEGLPQGWDLADKAPDGMDLVALLAEAPERDANAGALGGDDEYEQAVMRLAALPPHGYDRVRKAEAQRLHVRVGTLDDAVKATRASASDDNALQGHVLRWTEPEPWPEPVDGADLLDDLVELIQHFVVLPDGGAEAVTLWALYAWVFEAFDVAPNLMVTAPEREAGKTRVTELLSWMVPYPKPVSDASAAAIIRGIERDHPTLLFDEAQHFLKRRPDDPIRGILLASFSRRFAAVERCEGDNNEPCVFSTFTPKAMNGRKLANIDDMLTSRSVVIAMTRAPGLMPELRVDRDPVGDNTRRRCARWRDDHMAVLRDADPDTGGRIGRVAQVWRPLFAIADAAGTTWSDKARAAADSLATLTATVADSDTLGTMLLADVRTVFSDAGDPEHMPSKQIDEALIRLPERPWATLRHGDKPMTAQKRGNLLKPYGIHTVTIRVGDKTPKSYRRASFEPAWNAYLPGAMVVEPKHRNSPMESMT